MLMIITTITTRNNDDTYVRMIGFRRLHCFGLTSKIELWIFTQWLAFYLLHWNGAASCTMIAYPPNTETLRCKLSNISHAIRGFTMILQD